MTTAARHGTALTSIILADGPQDMGRPDPVLCGDMEARVRAEVIHLPPSDRSPGQAPALAGVHEAALPAGPLIVRPRILMASPSSLLRDPLARKLSEDGMRVSVARSREELFRAVGDFPSLVVLDLDFPGEDGLDVLRRLRAASDAPVMLMSATLRDETDRIVGLELGADDYLVSPIDPRELSARIRSILRRRNMASGALRLRPRTRVRFGIWELDCFTRRLHRDDTAPINLTKGEFALLNAFLGAPHQALSREALLHATRVHEDLSDRSIDVQILRLRRKLQTGREGYEVITTLRGVGYVFRAQVEAP